MLGDEWLLRKTAMMAICFDNAPTVSNLLVGPFPPFTIPEAREFSRADMRIRRHTFPHMAFSRVRTGDLHRPVPTQKATNDGKEGPCQESEGKENEETDADPLADHPKPSPKSLFEASAHSIH